MSRKICPSAMALLALAFALACPPARADGIQLGYGDFLGEYTSNLFDTRLSIVGVQDWTGAEGTLAPASASPSSVTASAAGIDLTTAITIGGDAASATYASSTVVILDAGTVHVAGGGTTVIDLVDSFRSSGLVSTGYESGTFSISAGWGPLISDKYLGEMDVQNAFSQNWDINNPSCNANVYSAPGIYSNTGCTSINSVQGIDMPLVVGDGDGLAIAVSIIESARGAASLQIQDPLSLVLQRGTTFSDVGAAIPIPVSYAQADAVPEPSGLALFLGGLLVLGGLCRRGERSNA